MYYLTKSEDGRANLIKLTLLTCSPYMSRCVRSEWTPITGHMLMTLGVRPIKTAISSLCKL